VAVPATVTGLSELDFAALVDEIAGDASRADELVDFLREDHPVYCERGTSTTVRMRGWVLLALARVGISDAALLFVLEELDSGSDPYLVAAAACALRSYRKPRAAFAPIVMGAIVNFRYRDDPVCLDAYGEYARSESGTSPVRELTETLAWLGPYSRGVLNELEAVRLSEPDLPKRFVSHLNTALLAIRNVPDEVESIAKACCTPAMLGDVSLWRADSRRQTKCVQGVQFQDHVGKAISFRQLFVGHPTVVVFFYTRCDNPLKCSLTISKLARIQEVLQERGLAEHVRTAAITYDPGFDLPERLRNYGQNRGVRLDASHRILRTIDGFDAIHDYFELGVNFVGSVVNRHRVEAYVLDSAGRIAARFERLRWDEQEIVNRAVEVMNEKDASASPTAKFFLPQFLTTIASVAIALFPKCPVCWASYLSLFGITVLEPRAYSTLLRLALIVVMLINIALVWRRGHSVARTIPLCLVGVGALSLLFKLMLDWKGAAICGVLFTIAGSVLSTIMTKTSRASTQPRLATETGLSRPPRLIGLRRRHSLASGSHLPA
jgi:protein SCO1/2